MRHVHSSGRYDAPNDALAQALHDYATKQRAVLITTTEVNRDSKRKVLAEFGKSLAYEVVQAAGDGPGNCAIMVHTEWQVLKTWSHALSEKEQRRGPGGPPPSHAITALIRSRTSGAERIVSVAHLPSHVEGDWRDDAYRVRLWRECVVEWKRHLRSIRRKHRGAKVIVVADWNLDLKKAWVRAVLRYYFPRLTLTWRTFPQDGTHHKRVIDATLTNVEITQPAHLLPDDASADHRPYGERLAS